MALPKPGIQTTVPGISLPEVAPGTVTTDATLTGDGGATPLSVVQSYALFLGSFLAAALPSAAAHQGALAVVTDSNTVTWGATVAGSGSSVVLVFSDGTNWTVAAK
jgi:hypothetical protein